MPLFKQFLKELKEILSTAGLNVTTHPTSSAAGSNPPSGNDNLSFLDVEPITLPSRNTNVEAVNRAVQTSPCYRAPKTFMSPTKVADKQVVSI